MSEEIGPVDVRESEEHPFLGREIAQPRHFWEETAKIADAAVKRLLSAADARAHDVLDKHRLQVERLVAALTAEETLDRSAVAALLRPRAVGYGGRARPGFGGGDAKTG